MADLPQEQARTLAVYYFTVGREVSGIRDYLINGLTTSLATQGKGRVQVVSRQVLDRILSEASFQMSDLGRERRLTYMTGLRCLTEVKASSDRHRVFELS